MKEQSIKIQLIQCREFLADLFQSGLANVPESLQKRGRLQAVHAGQYGLEWLSGQLTELMDRIERRRHVIGGDDAKEVCVLFCRIAEFTEEGIRLSGLEEAGVRIRQKEREQERKI